MSKQFFFDSFRLDIVYYQVYNSYINTYYRDEKEKNAFSHTLQHTQTLRLTARDCRRVYNIVIYAPHYSGWLARRFCRSAAAATMTQLRCVKLVAAAATTTTVKIYIFIIIFIIILRGSALL